MEIEIGWEVEVHEWCKFYRECYCGARSYRDGGRTRIRTILLTQN